MKKPLILFLGVLIFMSISVNGNFSVGDDIIGNNKAIGDTFYIGDRYVDGKTSFIYQCDFEMSGRACGLVFGAQSREKPSQSWYCLNYDSTGKSSRAFFVKGGLKWNISCGVDIKPGSRHTLKIIYIKDAEITFFFDDTIVGTYTSKDFEGGYLGVMTCYSDTTFSNIKYTEFNAKKISLDFVNIEFDKKYDDSVNEYLAYVGYDTKELILKADFDDDVNLKVNDINIESNKEKSIPLQIGCNQIPVVVSYSLEGTDISTNKYLTVHRAQKSSLLYKEDYRPRLHYTSAYEWINDPNGMMYNAATKEYHLFYQTRPRTSVHSPNQCWYHAVSKDLVHWEQLQPALTPDELGFCWSGSGNIDRFNTSKLFDDSTPPEGRMVLIYSSVYGETYYGVEKISLAYSDDNGITWKKYKGNPIIRNGENYKQEYNGGFRDPKLVWYEDPSYPNGGTWVMLVGGGQGRLFQSDNLIDWTFQSAMTDIDGNELQGECPDLFEIEVENEPGVKKWVYISGKLDLEKSPMVFQTTATVGTLKKDEKGKFIFVAEQKNKQVLYGGYCMYATQSFASSADGRRIQMSWLRDFISITGIDKKDKEVKDFTGCMSWPLELKLSNKNGSYILASYPVKEMETLRNKKIYDKKDLTVKQGENILKGINSKYYEVNCVIDVTKANESGFIVRQKGEKGIVIKCTDYNAEKNNIKVTIDASKCGKYPGEINYVTSSVINGKINMKIIVDTTVTDVFLNDGEESVFALSYPESSFENMEFYVKEGSVDIESLCIYELDPMWDESEKKSFDSLKFVLYMVTAFLGVTLCLLTLSLFKKPINKEEKK